jgi:alanine racemase
MFCFLGLHNWGQWQTVETYTITHRDYIGVVPIGEKRKTGKALLQQRCCTVCGKIQMDKQTVHLV